MDIATSISLEWLPALSTNLRARLAADPLYVPAALYPPDHGERLVLDALDGLSERVQG